MRDNHSFIIIKEGLPYVLGVFLCCVLCYVLGFVWVGVFCALVLVAVLRIFYNPERIPFEEGENLVLSPIDGFVRQISHRGKSTIVHISSPLFLVSILRSPFCGDMSVSRTKGLVFAHFDLASKTLSEFVEICCVSRFGRIYCRCYPLFCAKSLDVWFKAHVQKGERLGFMFCGVVELEICSSVRLRINEGDKIRGGETTIGIFS